MRTRGNAFWAGWICAALFMGAITAPSCAANAPPSLSPAGVRIYQANQALLVLDSLQQSAIGLNKIERCAQPPAATDCRPLLSDANTKLVIDVVSDGVNTIRTVPTGWKATVTTALKTIGSRLDAEGQKTLGAYISAASEILAQIA